MVNEQYIISWVTILLHDKHGRGHGTMSDPGLRLPRLCGWIPLVGAAAAGVFVGAWFASAGAAVRADGHAAKGPKAPLEEALHCPLAFAGVHLLKENPGVSKVAYHFCKPVNERLNQCVLYDGTGPDAKLIGIEYLVDDATYQAMPTEEKAYWHDHKHEIDAGLLKSLTQHGEEEKQTYAKVRTLWGKVYHTWVEGTDYPAGPAKLFWSVTGEKPFVLAPDAVLPPELAKPRSAAAR